MWPWEHAAVAYIVYSLLARLLRWKRPAAVTALAVLLGSQVPDLIDKPLAWWLQILPSGRSLGHSLLFALPIVVTAVWIARLRRRVQVGVAFAVGYLLHLPGDALYPVLTGGRPETEFLLYPIVPQTQDVGPGFVARFSSHFGDFLTFLQTSRGFVYFGGELGLLLTAMVLWVLDGKPGFGLFRRQVRRTITG